MYKNVNFLEESVERENDLFSFLVVFRRFPGCDACLLGDKQQLALRTWFTELTPVIWAIPWKSGCLLSANGTRRR